MTIVPIVYAFAMHQPPETTSLSDFRDGLGGGVLALVSGLGLLWFYLHLYWPDRLAAKVLEQPTPYAASFNDQPSTSSS